MIQSLATTVLTDEMARCKSWPPREKELKGLVLPTRMSGIVMIHKHQHRESCRCTRKLQIQVLMYVGRDRLSVLHTMAYLIILVTICILLPPFYR